MMQATIPCRTIHVHTVIMITAYSIWKVVHHYNAPRSRYTKTSEDPFMPWLLWTHL